MRRRCSVYFCPSSGLSTAFCWYLHPVVRCSLTEGSLYFPLTLRAPPYVVKKPKNRPCALYIARSGDSPVNRPYMGVGCKLAEPKEDPAKRPAIVLVASCPSTMHSVLHRSLAVCEQAFQLLTFSCSEALPVACYTAECSRFYGTACCLLHWGVQQDPGIFSCSCSRHCQGATCRPAPSVV